MDKRVIFNYGHQGTARPVKKKSRSDSTFESLSGSRPSSRPQNQSNDIILRAPPPPNLSRPTSSESHSSTERTSPHSRVPPLSPTARTIPRPPPPPSISGRSGSAGHGNSRSPRQESPVVEDPRLNARVHATQSRDRPVEQAHGGSSSISNAQKSSSTTVLKPISFRIPLPSAPLPSNLLSDEFPVDDDDDATSCKTMDTAVTQPFIPTSAKGKDELSNDDSTTVAAIGTLATVSPTVRLVNLPSHLIRASELQSSQVQQRISVPEHRKRNHSGESTTSTLIVQRPNQPKTDSNPPKHLLKGILDKVLKKDSSESKSNSGFQKKIPTINDQQNALSKTKTKGDTRPNEVTSSKRSSDEGNLGSSSSTKDNLGRSSKESKENKRNVDDTSLPVEKSKNSASIQSRNINGDVSDESNGSSASKRRKLGDTTASSSLDKVQNLSNIKVMSRDSNKKSTLVTELTDEKDTPATVTGLEGETAPLKINIAPENRRSLAPKIIRQSSDLTARLGSIAKFDVDFEGEPPPTIAWRMNGKPLRPGPAVKLENSDYNSKLAFRPVTRGDSGSYTITATNSSGTDSITIKLLVKSKPGKPEGPLIVSNVVKNGCELSWKKPCDDGSCPIKYEIQKLDKATGDWTEAGTSTEPSVKFINLTPESSYKFRVKTVNSEGESEHLVTESFTVAKDPLRPPGKPEGTLTVSDVSKTGCKLTWRKPGDDGGCPIEYEVEKLDVTSTSELWTSAGTSTGTEFVINDLVKGSSYKFRVKAVNSVGDSEYLVTESSIVATDPLRLPGKPEGTLTVSDVNKNGCKLTWKKPGDDGGCPIEYEVEKLDITSTSGLWSSAGTSKKTTIVIIDLVKGSSYKFRVKAVNSVGDSEYLVTESSIVATDPLRLPGKPEGTLTVSDVNKNGCQLTWQKPCDDGGCSIIKYAIQIWDMTSELWSSAGISTETSFVITDLVPESSYKFRVKTLNSVGDSEYLITDSSIVAKDPLRQPGKPEGSLTVSDVNKTGCKLTWRKPGDDGGCPIEYEVEKLDMTSTSGLWSSAGTSTVTEFVITDLVPESSYKFRVKTVNSVGESEHLVSESAIITKDVGLPTAVESSNGKEESPATDMNQSQVQTSSTSTTLRENYPVLQLPENTDHEDSDFPMVTIRTDVFSSASSEEEGEETLEQEPVSAAENISLTSIIRNLKTKLFRKLSENFAEIQAVIDGDTVNASSLTESQIYHEQIGKLLSVIANQWEIVDEAKIGLCVLEKKEEPPSTLPSPDVLKSITIDQMAEYLKCLVLIGTVHNEPGSSSTESPTDALSFIGHRVLRILNYHYNELQQRNREEGAGILSVDLLSKKICEGEGQWTRESVVRAWDEVRLFKTDQEREKNDEYKRAIALDHEKIGPEGFLKKVKAMVDRISKDRPQLSSPGLPVNPSVAPAALPSAGFRSTSISRLSPITPPSPAQSHQYPGSHANVRQTFMPSLGQRTVQTQQQSRMKPGQRFPNPIEHNIATNTMTIAAGQPPAYFHSQNQQTNFPQQQLPCTTIRQSPTIHPVQVQASHQLQQQQRTNQSSQQQVQVRSSPSEAVLRSQLQLQHAAKVAMQNRQPSPVSFTPIANHQQVLLQHQQQQQQHQQQQQLHQQQKQRQQQQQHQQQQQLNQHQVHQQQQYHQHQQQQHQQLLQQQYPSMRVQQSPSVSVQVIPQQVPSTLQQHIQRPRSHPSVVDPSVPVPLNNNLIINLQWSNQQQYPHYMTVTSSSHQASVAVPRYTVVPQSRQGQNLPSTNSNVLNVDGNEEVSLLYSILQE